MLRHKLLLPSLSLLTAVGLVEERIQSSTHRDNLEAALKELQSALSFDFHAMMVEVLTEERMFHPVALDVKVAGLMEVDTALQYGVDAMMAVGRMEADILQA